MDIKKRCWTDNRSEGTGVPYTRLIVKYNGHTHIYQFPDAQAHEAHHMIRLHVMEGSLHPAAGVVLMGMI